MKNYLIFICFPLIFVFIGCATYGSKTEQVRLLFTEGKYDDALKKLEKTKSDRSMVLYLMEKGIILHYSGRYEDSNKTFEEAEVLSDELYTKSISREASAFLTSDNILSYEGEKFERALIHYYRAMNYIYLKLPDDALVECRKVILLLQKYSDEAEGKTTAYLDDAFMQYLSGILFEWRGELNDAFISYRKAESGFEKYEKEYGIQQPSSLKNDLLRLSKVLDFTEEYEFYLKKYNTTYVQPEGVEKSGELILIHENGMAPIKTSMELVFPILKADNLSGKTDVLKYSGELRGRAGRKYNDVDLEYLLRVSIPQYVSSRPKITYMKASVDGIQKSSELAEDVEAIAFRNFAEREPLILLKTIARGITKYLAFRTARDKKGETLGLLVNIINVATESADTRSWLTLPNSLSLIRMSVPPGQYNIQLSFFNKGDQQIDSAAINNLEIKENSFTFVSYRTFE